MQSRCDVDAPGLRHAGTPTRAFAGSTEVRGACFGLVAALAGGGYLALARAGVIGGIAPADLTLLRFGVAGVLLLPVLFRYGIRDLAGVGWRRGLVLAVLAGPPFALLQTGGFVFAPLAHGAIIMPAAVTIIAMLLAIVTLLEHIDAAQLAGTGVVILGLVLIGADGLGVRSCEEWVGDLMFVGAGSMLAAYTVLMRRWRLAAAAATAAVSLLSLVTFLPVYFFCLGADHISGLPAHGLILQAFGQGGLAGVVLMMAYSRAVMLLGASRAALFPSLVPVLAILIGVPLTGEAPDPLQFAGLALVTAGLLAAIHVLRRRGPIQVR
jgi:drug/metabolite transporter (DMT)-like permease